MVYSPHSHPSTHKYDASPTSKNADYSAMDSPGNKDMYDALDKSKYDALKEYMKKDDDGLLSKDYQNKKSEEDNNKKQKSKDSIENNIEREEKKEKNGADGDGVIDITKKAAEEIRVEINKNKDDFKKKKNLKSIEEAIKKAINDEKEIIHNN